VRDQFDSVGEITARVDSQVEVYLDGGEQFVSRYPLDGTHLIIGRTTDASVVLDHETVSRPHAELVCGPFGRWWIHDLGSTNGTFVNGSRVSDRMLSPGDEIQIGCYTLRLRLPGRRRLESTLPPATRPARPKSVVDDTEATRVLSIPQQAPHIGAAHLTMTMSLGRTLMGLEDPVSRLKAVCSFIVGDDFPGRSVSVLRMRGPTSIKVLYGPVVRAGGRDSATDEYSKSVLVEVWSKREAVVASNATFAIRKLTLPSTVHLMAVVASPIWQDDDRVDLIYVELPVSYGTDEWRTLMALVSAAYAQAEIVSEMRRHVRAAAFIERELEMARDIQDRLVPHEAGFEGLDVAIGYEPCRWVGGDYVDALAMPDGRVLIAIADVCDKRLQASLVSASVHTMVIVVLDTEGVDGSLNERAVVELVVRMNNYLCSYLPEDSFVTLTCIALDPATGDLHCVNAGHPAALVLAQRDGRVRPLQSEKNIALGIMDTRFEVERSVLAVGEVLLLYTDGLTEMRDEQRIALGEERFAAAVSDIVCRHADASVAALKDALVSYLNSYRGSQLSTDDTTFLFARRSGPRAAD